MTPSLVNTHLEVLSGQWWQRFSVPVISSLTSSCSFISNGPTVTLTRVKAAEERAAIELHHMWRAARRVWDKRQQTDNRDGMKPSRKYQHSRDRVTVWLSYSDGTWSQRHKTHQTRHIWYIWKNKHPVNQLQWFLLEIPSNSSSE